MANVVLSTAWGGKQMVSMGCALSGHLGQNTSGERSFPATQYQYGAALGWCVQVRLV